uniref:Metalloendopeptidase n=1 Tax=Megaselia scalaris TaxID=36166 RepID=T1GTB9_MEGSC
MQVLIILIIFSSFVPSIPSQNNDSIVMDDMVLSRAQFDEWFSEHGAFRGRNSKGEEFKWKDGIVPYSINESLGYIQRNIIAQAIEDIEEVTCVRFRKATPEDKYQVHITNDRPGCFAEVGFLKKPVQTFNIYPNECSKRAVIHEFLHVLSFTHEQSASERDKYVKILMENVADDKKHNFLKNKRDTNLGVPYDYNSIMHYSNNAFSKNNNPTIVSITDGGEVPERLVQVMSEKDILRIIRLYKCKDKL